MGPVKVLSVEDEFTTAMAVPGRVTGGIAAPQPPKNGT